MPVLEVNIDAASPLSCAPMKVSVRQSNLTRGWNEVTSKECSRASSHALRADLEREHRDEGSRVMLSKLDVGAELGSCSVPQLLPILEIEMPEFPTSLFPIGVFPGEKPILFIILKHTDRINMYARLEPSTK